MDVIDAGWEDVARRLKVVTLSPLAYLAVPLLTIPAFPKATRGFALFPGRAGVVVGGALTAAAACLTFLLGSIYGVFALAVFWAFGTYGLAMAVGSFRPAAFVKPICTKCRLLPVIKEHESIHHCGVPGERDVWSSMKKRHSVESLKLSGDPAICKFCPIPKRLAE